MTFVGVRIEGGWFEVGFKAATRREFDEHQRVIAAAADLFWPQSDEPMDLSRDPAEPSRAEDFVEPLPETPLQRYARDRQMRREWLENQGLA